MPVAFSYPSLTGTMNDHVRALVDFAHAQDVPELHFVGHSLGGFVILRALQLTDDLPPGRAVLLGTPLQGSKAAQGVARILPFRQSDSWCGGECGDVSSSRRVNGEDIAMWV